MKSEHEFLTAIWSEIDAKECEAKEKLVTHELNKRLLLKEIYAYLLIVMLIAAGSMIAILVKDNPDIVYVIAAFLLAAAFFSERLFDSKSQEVSSDEN